MKNKLFVVIIISTKLFYNEVFAQNFNLVVDLASINFFTLTGDCYYRDLGFVRNYSLACTWFDTLGVPHPNAYYIYNEVAYYNPNLYSILRSSADPIGWASSWPLVPKYTDTPDPNFIGKLFSDPILADPCPLLIASTTGLCDEVQPRLKNPDLIDKIKPEISIHPNPSSDFLIIENAELETTIKISNIMGEIINEINVGNSSFQIDLKNYQPGIYFIRTENGYSYKFIKI